MTRSEAHLQVMAEDTRHGDEARGDGLSDRDRRACDHGRLALRLLRHFVEEAAKPDGLPQWLVINIQRTAAEALIGKADQP